MKKLPLFLTALSILASAVPLTGCSKTVKPGDVKGYDEGEQYISMWVHTIEDTPEGEAYKASVERFNEKYDGTYFADIEFIPRNDSGGGYSDKINASVMSGDLPDVITVDGEYFCLCSKRHYSAAFRIERGRKIGLSGFHSGAGNGR